MVLTRRNLLSLSAAGLLPLPLWAHGAGLGERKFLFIIAAGGWDTSYVFTPTFDMKGIEDIPDTSLVSVGDLSFVAHPNRPSVSQFFEEQAHRSAIINGMEVRSVTHERCTRLLLTAQSVGGDDWAAQIASQSSLELPMPHMVVHGPAFVAQTGASVVRGGSNGQLMDLLDGRALTRVGSELPAHGSLVDDALLELLDESSAHRFAHIHVDLGVPPIIKK